jgi:hypothetical protein
MHPSTLFHLVPTNELSRNSLLHPNNEQFVSNSEDGRGLEVGYHVPSRPQGHVITRLGRDADLVLRQSNSQLPVSAVHVAFEIHPTTQLVVLIVRSKRTSSVSFAILGDEGKYGTREGITRHEITLQDIPGDGVMLYGQNYKICIASYSFNLVWRAIFSDARTNAKSLKSLAIQGYQTSLQLLQGVGSQLWPTKQDDSEAQSWHITRLNTAKDPVFRDIKSLRRPIGSGSFGTVYEAIDWASGHKFAIKVVHLDRYNTKDRDLARAGLHREIKIMGRVKHVSSATASDLSSSMTYVLETHHRVSRLPAVPFFRTGDLHALARWNSDFAR